jgi:hypothetical protein
MQISRQKLLRNRKCLKLTKYGKLPYVEAQKNKFLFYFVIAGISGCNPEPLSRNLIRIFFRLMVHLI